MRSKRFVRVLKVAAIAVVGIAVGGEVVTQLWNWLMPELFGWHVIGFGQALGLLVLSRIFFGGFRGRGGFGRQRWERMTPEQREQFKQGMRGGRCGKFETPVAAEPTGV